MKANRAIEIEEYWYLDGVDLSAAQDPGNTEWMHQQLYAQMMEMDIAQGRHYDNPRVKAI